ncbi:MAG: hypothetical protein NC313_02115 [Butyrivibrio sp.]|nr:hypothetical protein [Butyrivibrio sp.]
MRNYIVMNETAHGECVLRQNITKKHIVWISLMLVLLLGGCGSAGQQAQYGDENGNEAGSGGLQQADGSGTDSGQIQQNDNSSIDETLDSAPIWTGYIADFDDLDSMGEYFRIDWESQLSERTFAYGGCRSDAKEYMDSSINSNDEREFTFYFYTLDEFSIPTFHKTTAYGYISDRRAYIMSMDKESFEEITSSETAMELAEIIQNMFLYRVSAEDYEQEELATMISSIEYINLATVISYLGLADGRMFDGKVDLSTSGTAAVALLHYAGGAVTSIPYDIYGNYRIATYTFADGGSISWYMTQYYENRASNGMGTFWFPHKPCSEEDLEKALTIQQYMTNVSVDSLKEITKEADSSDRDWMTLPENEDGDMFVIIYTDEKEDITLYGLYGGSGMALRDGSDIYLIYGEWLNRHVELPYVKKADYDNDGTPEYALWMLGETGHSYHLEDLFMLEPDAEQETGLRVHQFTIGDMMYQFANINYTFDEETNILQVDTGTQSMEMDLTQYLTDKGGEFSSLSWGDIIYLEEKNGQWHITMDVGVMLSNYATPLHDCGISFTAPIEYMENGYFQTGKITVNI